VSSPSSAGSRSPSVPYGNSVSIPTNNSPKDLREGHFKAVLDKKSDQLRHERIRSSVRPTGPQGEQ